MNFPNNNIVITAHDQKLISKFVCSLKKNNNDIKLIPSISQYNNLMIFSFDDKIIYNHPESSLNFNDLLNFTSHIQKISNAIILTQSPWIISDFDQKNVFVVNDDGKLEHPKFQTFGTSVNKITMCLLNKRETIGTLALSKLNEIRKLVENDPSKVSDAINLLNSFGDSIELNLTIKTFYDIQEKYSK